MARANGSTPKRCRPYAHKWNQDVCMVCYADSPAGARSRAYNAMMARIVAAGPDAYGKIPPAPDYSTPEAVRERALEAGAGPWYRAFMAISRQDGRSYRAFKASVVKAGATLALPFPTTTVRVTTGPVVEAPTTTTRPVRRAPRARPSAVAVPPMAPTSIETTTRPVAVCPCGASGAALTHCATDESWHFCAKCRRSFAAGCRPELHAAALAVSA